MKRLIFLIVMIMSLNTSGQNYQASKDAENGSVVMKGPISMADLANETSFGWFKQNAAYTPDATAIATLKTRLGGYDMVVVMGTWCEDSQNLVPKLNTVLQLAGYPLDSVRMFGVDRSKDALNGEKAKYAIEKVPTIILYKDGQEAGRITETVQKSIEADLAAIVSK
jgi:thiol-disulfide isomerase/thioredoxin